MQEFRVRFIRIPRWQIALGAGLVLALLAAFFVLALGLFFLLLPAFLVLAAMAYLFGGSRARVGGAADDRTIDGEYRVVEQRRIEERDRLP